MNDSYTFTRLKNASTTKRIIIKNKTIISENNININDYSEGVYFVKISNNKGEKTFKIVLQK
ncbi:MAG: T9SS type A sorting domain-containing protein [Bacteroidales bacterium]|nr:T9SS type A sorting domain-containing protein [Bacteroidales bacterium]